MSLLFGDSIALKEMCAQLLRECASEGHLRRCRGRAHSIMTKKSTQIHNKTVFQDSNIHNEHVDVSVSGASSGEGTKLEATYLNRL
jgi:hypothetical protein